MIIILSKYNKMTHPLSQSLDYQDLRQRLTFKQTNPRNKNPSDRAKTSSKTSNISYNNGKRQKEINNSKIIQKLPSKLITCIRFDNNKFEFGPTQTVQSYSQNQTISVNHGTSLDIIKIQGSKAHYLKKKKRMNIFSYLDSMNQELIEKQSKQFNFNKINFDKLTKEKCQKDQNIETRVIRTLNPYLKKVVESKRVIKNQLPLRFLMQSKSTFLSKLFRTSKTLISKAQFVAQGGLTLISLKPQLKTTSKIQQLQNDKSMQVLVMDKRQQIQKKQSGFIRKVQSKPRTLNNETQYYGSISLMSTPKQIFNLKLLYYKDLIWKVSYNQGFKVEADSNLVPRYYIGKGNNSRLIRNIMARRWWWVHEPKLQKANIVWTQLKTYSIYQFQPTQKKAILQQVIEHKDVDDLIWQQKRLSLGDKCCILLTEQKYNKWRNYITNPNNLRLEKKTSQTLNTRHRFEKDHNIKIVNKTPNKVSNHLQYSRMIGNKKALYQTMKMYQSLVTQQSIQYLPLTYHLTNGIENQQYLKFLTSFYTKNKQKQTMWIVKPGEMSNRGRGITVCKELNQIKAIIKSQQTHENGLPRTYIIQEYIDNPLLYNFRKFDIRHYIMISSVDGKIRGYFYEQGYIRTTSYRYTLENNNPFVHLTNDAVQKYAKDYGKYEKGNKLSYEEFQKYIQQTYHGKRSFYRDVYPEIRKVSREIIRASYNLIDPKRRTNNFEIFGLDIMVDSDFKVWLIEVNTNPCLQLSSPVLSNVIPRMLQNAFSIVLDTQYPPPNNLSFESKKIYLLENSILSNKFELIFDENISGAVLDKCYLGRQDQIQKMDGYGSDDEAYQSTDEKDQ